MTISLVLTIAEQFRVSNALFSDCLVYDFEGTNRLPRLKILSSWYFYAGIRGVRNSCFLSGIIHC